MKNQYDLKKARTKRLQNQNMAAKKGCNNVYDHSSSKIIGINIIVAISWLPPLITQLIFTLVVLWGGTHCHRLAVLVLISVLVVIASAIGAFILLDFFLKYRNEEERRFFVCSLYDCLFELFCC